MHFEQKADSAEHGVWHCWPRSAIL